MTLGPKAHKGEEIRIPNTRLLLEAVMDHETDVLYSDETHPNIIKGLLCEVVTLGCGYSYFNCCLMVPYGIPIHRFEQHALLNYLLLKKRYMV